jgi:hypothetical protein
MVCNYIRNNFTNCPSAKPDDSDNEDEIEDDEEPVPAKVAVAPKTKPKIESGAKGRHKTIVPAASDVSLNHPIKLTIIDIKVYHKDRSSRPPTHDYPQPTHTRPHLLRELLSPHNPQRGREQWRAVLQTPYHTLPPI